jgi:hypothetical protein
MDQERRVKSRYPLRLNVRYQTLGTANRIADVGQTLNLSSSGVLMTCTSSINEGEKVRAVFEWPSRLDGTIPLQLVTVGIVVRRQVSELAIAFEGYQFRTAGRRAEVAAVPQRRPLPNYHGLGLTSLHVSAKSSH